jgi:hypothetical protein
MTIHQNLLPISPKQDRRKYKFNEHLLENAPPMTAHDRNVILQNVLCILSSAVRFFKRQLLITIIPDYNDPQTSPKCPPLALRTFPGEIQQKARSEEVIRGSQFPRNIMPDIVRPSFQDTGTSHDMKAVGSDMLRRVSIVTHERRGGGAYRVGAKHSWSING